MSADQDKQKLKERQTIRLKVLKSMFDATIGENKDPTVNSFSSEVMAEGLGLSISEVNLALQYLDGQQLIGFVGTGGTVRDTYYKLMHYGITEVERAIEYPDQRTEHFMLSVIQHFHAPVGSVQGGPNATANVEQRTE